MKGQWINVYSGDLALRSWWVDSGSESEYISIVLPEVFGINHWIRSFSQKLAKQNVPVLALPLYGRTAPKLDRLVEEEKSGTKEYYRYPTNYSETSVGGYYKNPNSYNSPQNQKFRKVLPKD